MDTQAARIIRKFGSQAALAKAIGRKSNTISAWLKVGWVPAHRQDSVRTAARKLGIELTMDDWFPDSSKN